MPIYTENQCVPSFVASLPFSSHLLRWITTFSSVVAWKLEMRTKHSPEHQLKAEYTETSSCYTGPCHVNSDRLVGSIYKDAQLG